MEKKYLILGAAGFIGRNLVEFLMADNQQVHVFDRVNTRFIFKEEEVKHVDFYDFSSDKIIEYVRENEIDVLVHLVSGLLPASDINEYYREIELVIIPTCKIIDELKNSAVKFVYFSSGGAIYGNSQEVLLKEDINCTPINYYGYAKLVIEKFITTVSTQSSLKYLILRPSNPYGRYQNVNGKQGFIAVSAGKLLNGKDIEIWGDGSVVRDYIYIDDLCGAFVKLINNNVQNKILNVGSGEGHSLNFIMDVLFECFSGNNRSQVSYQSCRKVDVAHAVLDIRGLKDAISFDPTPIDVGIRRFITYLLSST